MGRRKFSLYRLCIAFCIAVLLGLVSSRLLQLQEIWSPLLLLVLLPLLLQRSIVSLSIVILCGTFIGYERGAIFLDSQSYIEDAIGTSVSVKGVVIDDPVYSRLSQTEFHLGELRFGTDQHKTKGRLRIRSFEAANAKRGDTVVVTGKLSPGFGNRQASMSFAKLETLSRSDSVVEKVRSWFFASIYTILPEPQSSLGLGFVVGIRTLLPDKLLDELSVTGLTHIVAVSGYNLTILVRLMRRAFAKRSKYQAIASSVLLMITFILITGATPSIMRASIVAGFALAGWAYGRRMHPLVAILLGAAVTAYINPYYLWYDIGWYLSFTAFFGVLVLAPVIKKRFFNDKLGFIGETALESLSAQIMTMPLIAFVFSEVSLISLVANIVVVPLIPYAMLLTVIPVLVMPLSLTLAGWLSWPAKVVLTYITEVISFFSRLSSAQIQLNMTLRQMIFVYVMILTVLTLLVVRHKITLDGTRLVQ